MRFYNSFLLSFMLVVLTNSVFSQDRDTTLKTKNGIEILPQKGDVAIQFDARPAINYMGNLFSSTTSPVINSPFGSGVFVGKYFTSATEAYRVKFGFNLSKSTSDTSISYGANQEYIISRNTQVQNVILGFGKEWRRGYRRLQGVYGVEGLLQIGSSNPYNSKNYNLTIKQAVDTGVESIGVARDLGTTKLVGFGFGVRAFIGVEYFILPRISLGGEFGWGLGYQFERTESKQEIYTTEEKVITTPGNKISGFVINNDAGGTIFGGSTTISVSFHF